MVLPSSIEIISASSNASWSSEDFEVDHSNVLAVWFLDEGSYEHSDMQVNRSIKRKDIALLFQNKLIEMSEVFGKSGRIKDIYLVI